MEIKCYKNTDDGLILTSVIDDFTSFQFTRSYTGCGSWQLVLNAETRNAQQALDMNYISVNDKIAGVVETVKNNVGDKNTLIFTGSELKGITKNRIVIPPSDKAYLHIHKHPANVIIDIINSQLINAEDFKRQFPNVSIDTNIVTDDIKMTYDGRFSNVYDDINEIATAYNIGWYAAIKPINNTTRGEIVFYLYTGVDRTASQNINSRFILSYDNEAIQSSNYSNNKTLPSTAVVAGKGEGTERTVVPINNNITGINRKEVYIDARDAEDDLLVQRGNEKLSEYGDATNYDIILSQSLNKQYHKSFELGDIATVRDYILNIQVDSRLTEITEVYENDMIKLNIILGYDKSNLAAVITRRNSNTQTLLRVEDGGGGGGGNYLPLTGGTLTGALTVNDYIETKLLKLTAVTEDNTLNKIAVFGNDGWLHYLTKENLLGNYLPLTGGTLTGNLNFNSNANSIGINANNELEITSSKIFRKTADNIYILLDANNYQDFNTYSTIRLTSNEDATITSTNHAFQVGDTEGLNLIIDNNEIMSRNNGVASKISINHDGGEVSIGSIKGITNIFGQPDVGIQFHVGAGEKVRFHYETSGEKRTIFSPYNSNGPKGSGKCYLGTYSYRWNTAFFANAITASDEKEKDIQPNFIDAKKFIMGLKPITYHRTAYGDTGQRFHMGFGAQTTYKMINKENLGDLCVCQASIINEDGSESSYHGEKIDDTKLRWGINYTEIIAPLVKVVQQQQQEIDELKEIIKRGVKNG